MAKETTNITDFKPKEVERDEFGIIAYFSSNIKFKESTNSVKIINSDVEIKVDTDKPLKQEDFLSIYLYLLIKIVHAAKTSFNIDHATIIKRSLDIIKLIYEKEENND